MRVHAGPAAGLLDADELEAGLSGWLAPVALDPRWRPGCRARGGQEAAGRTAPQKKKPPAGGRCAR